MEGSWWKERGDLDDSQEEIIRLPADGKYLVIGPPGCGKTNLLVLRGAYLYKSQYKNIAVITFAVGLVDFIRTGVKGLDSSQVHSYLSWARSHALSLAPEHSQAINDTQKFDELRNAILLACIDANKKIDNKNYLQAILFDEVQDINEEELKIVDKLSERIMLAGDKNQSIYKGDGIEYAKNLGYKLYELKTHYRIGHAIARVADKIFEPNSQNESLVATSNYNEQKMQSSAEHLHFESRQEQFDAMFIRLKTQLKAYPKEILGIFIGRKQVYEELKQLFKDTDLANEVEYHDIREATFSGEKRIHVLTVHAAKGTEFRAVHLYGCEDVQYPQTSHRYWYTAVTRAKTSLTAYSSPGGKSLSKILLAAFSDTTVPTIDSLFE